MTAEKFYKNAQYAQNISQLIEEYNRAESEISKLQNFISMSEQMRAHDKAFQYKDMLGKVTETSQAILNVLKEKTGREGIVAVREFMEELSDKLSMVNELRQNAGRSKSAHEINIATDVYTTPEDRAKAEKDVAINNEQYEKALELVSALVPAVSNVIITGAPRVPSAAKLSLV